MKILKIILVILTTLLTLIVVGIIGLIFTVNPNNFKPEISKFIYKNTGRELIIGGNISWSLYPHLGLKVKQVSLGNTKEFATQDFLKIGEANVSLKLLPMFHAKIEAGKIILKDAEINLLRDASGKTNWDDLANLSASSSNQLTSLSRTNQASEKNLALVAISGIDIENANLNWNDLNNHQALQIRGLNIQTDNISFAHDFNLKSNGSFKTVNPDLSGEFTLSSKINLRKDQRLLTLSNFSLDGDVVQNSKKTTFKINNDLKLDLKQEKINLTNLTGKIAELNFAGQLNGDHVLTSPNLSGTFSASTTSLRQFLQNLNLTFKVRDQSVLQNLNLTANWQLSNQLIFIPQLKLTLDESNLQGKNITIDLNRHRINFNWSLDKINVNRYDIETPQARPKVNSSSSSSAAPQTTQPIAIPIAPIPNWQLDGNWAIGKLTVGKADLSNCRMHLNFNNQLTTIDGINADFYEGTLKGQTSINFKSMTNPTLSLQIALTKIHLENLLKTLVNSNSFAGTLSLNANLTTRGIDTDVMLKNLNGSGNLKIDDGVLRGVDITGILDKAEALIHHLTLPKSSNSNQTNFNQMTGTFVIRNGIGNNDDLKITAQNYRLTGTGNSNLLTQSLDYQVRAYRTTTEDGTPKTSEVFVPIKITGTYSNLHYYPDFNYVLKNFLIETTKQIKQNIIENIKNGEHLGKDLGRNLNQKLKDIFGR